MIIDWDHFAVSLPTARIYSTEIIYSDMVKDKKKNCLV